MSVATERRVTLVVNDDEKKFNVVIPEEMIGSEQLRNLARNFQWAILLHEAQPHPTNSNRIGSCQTKTAQLSTTISLALSVWLKWQMRMWHAMIALRSLAMPKVKCSIYDTKVYALANLLKLLSKKPTNPPRTRLAFLAHLMPGSSTGLISRRRSGSSFHTQQRDTFVRSLQVLL